MDNSQDRITVEQIARLETLALAVYRHQGHNTPLPKFEARYFVKEGLWGSNMSIRIDDQTLRVDFEPWNKNYALKTAQDAFKTLCHEVTRLAKARVSRDKQGAQALLDKAQTLEEAISAFQAKRPKKPSAKVAV